MKLLPSNLSEKRIQGWRFRVKLLLVLIRKFLPYHIRDTIVVSGAARRGTTWLAEILNTLPQSAILFEPPHIRRIPQARAAGFNWETLLTAEDRIPKAYSFMLKVLSGRLINTWTAREFGKLRFSECLGIKTWIVKFVRAHMLLDWLTASFPIRRPVLIIRHPCAVVASQVRREWRYRMNSPHSKLRGITSYLLRRSDK